jgi:hypothetical protein
LDFRVYKLNAAGRIMSGEWIEAESEAQACELARAMCDEATPNIEVWQGARRVAVLPCKDDAAA